MPTLKQRIPTGVECLPCRDNGKISELWRYVEFYDTFHDDESTEKLMVFDRCENCCREFVIRDGFGLGRAPYHRIRRQKPVYRNFLNGVDGKIIC